MTYIYKIGIIAWLSLISFTCFAQFSDEKTISDGGVIDKSAKISITNKHGNINLTSWDKDSIKIRAVIKGESKSLGKLNEAMAKTKVNILLKNTYAEISTVIDESTVQQGVSGLKGIVGQDNNISIDYEIFAPKEAKLMISNKFGDLYMEEHLGEVNVSVSHGNFRASNLPNLQMLNGNFANIYIAKTRTMSGTIRYSELEIDEAIKLIITSKSSRYEVDRVDEFSISSANDKVNIRSLDELTMSGNLTKLRVDKLTKAATINLRYGSVRISQLTKDVCHLDMQTVRTTVDLKFDQASSFSIMGNHQDGEFNASGSQAHLKLDGSRLSGYYGSNASPSCTFLLNGQKSKLFIR